MHKVERRMVKTNAMNTQGYKWLSCQSDPSIVHAANQQQQKIEKKFHLSLKYSAICSAYVL